MRLIRAAATQTVSRHALVQTSPRVLEVRLARAAVTDAARLPAATIACSSTCNFDNHEYNAPRPKRSL
eukprot:4344363-Pleurochrysis_carterae.AAC.2